MRADAEIPRLEKILELKKGYKHDFDLNSILRKRMRETKHDLIKHEEEAKRPKNFAFPMVPSLDQKD